MTVSEREKAEKEQHELVEANADRIRNVSPGAEHHVEVPATNAKGDEDKVVEVHCVGGYCYLSTHGEARFDQDALVTLLAELKKAFQAVS